MPLTRFPTSSGPAQVPSPKLSTSARAAGRLSSELKTSPRLAGWVTLGLKTPSRPAGQPSLIPKTPSGFGKVPSSRLKTKSCQTGQPSLILKTHSRLGWMPSLRLKTQSRHAGSPSLTAENSHYPKKTSALGINCRFFAVFDGIDSVGGGGLGNVPPGQWKLAEGKTAPAVAAPGNGQHRVSVLKGRRNREVHTLSAAPPGRISRLDYTGGGVGGLPPANFRRPSGTSPRLPATAFPTVRSKNNHQRER